MNKVFKKALIGILFTIFAIPIISKNNIYAASTTVKKNNYHNCTNSKGEGFSISEPFYCKGVAQITGSCFGKGGAGWGYYSSCSTKMYLISATNKEVVATSGDMKAAADNTKRTLTKTINIDATKDYGICYILLPATHTCNTGKSGVEGFCWPDDTSTFELEVTGDYTETSSPTSSSVDINTSSGQSSLFAVNGVSHIIVPCILNDGASSGNYATASMKVSLIKSNNSVIKSFSHDHRTGYSSSNYDNGISRNFQFERIKGTAYAIIDGLDINTDYGDCYIKVEGSTSNSGSAKASYAYTSPAIVFNSANANPTPRFQPNSYVQSNGNLTHINS